MKRLLTSHDMQHMAQLRQFMLSHGVPVTVTESGGELELWVVHERYWDAAQQLLVDFEHSDKSALPENSGSVLGPTLQSLATQAGPLTFLVFVAVLIVAGLQFFWSMDTMLGALMISEPGSRELGLHQPWRLLTPAFLHMSATHLFFNLFWWWYLGGRIELSFGPAHLALIFLVTGVSANLLQWATSGPLFGGLSGVVYGLLGFCTVYGWQRHTRLTLPPALIVFMVAWLALGYTNLLWVNMANEAHLMGLLSGLFLGAIYRRRYPA